MICQPATKRPLNKEDKKQVLSQYLSGMSLHQVQMLNLELKPSAIYDFLKQEGVVRPRGGLGDDPSEEELLKRRDFIKQSWTDEQASKRWVGRSSSKMREMGHSLSQLIPD